MAERDNMKYYIEYEHLYEVKRKQAICTREQLVELLKNPLYSLYVARLFNPELDNYDNVEELVIR